MNLITKTNREKGFSLAELLLVVSMVILAGAIGFVATVNNVFNPAPPKASPPVSTVKPVPYINPDGPIYVAMGDSYSGWGADRYPGETKPDESVYDKATPCWRNIKTSAQVLLAHELGYGLIDVACGGSTTLSILSENFNGQQPMIKAVNSDTSLVTMTTGGNDTALMYLLGVCIQKIECPANGVIDGGVADKIKALPTNLKKIYKQITDIAQNVTIVHAGYPYIISAPGESRGTCSWLSAKEQKLFHTRLTGTNDAIKKTIAEFVAETGKDVRYADPLAADSPFMKRDDGQMRDGCSTNPKRYMLGTKDGESGGWHPNIYGQEHYAEIYKKALGK